MAWQVVKAVGRLAATARRIPRRHWTSTRDRDRRPRRRREIHPRRTATGRPASGSRAHRRHCLAPRSSIGEACSSRTSCGPYTGAKRWSSGRRPGSSTIDPASSDIPADVDIVWVEGTGVIRHEFAQWIDASIWMQGDLDEQESRLVARDGDAPAQQQHIARWLKEELPLMLREQPWEKATIIVSGAPELDYDPETEIVVASPARS